MTSHYTAFRCPDDLLTRAKIKAKAARRSLSNYLVILIADDVKDVPLPEVEPKAAKSAKAPAKSPKAASKAKK